MCGRSTFLRNSAPLNAGLFCAARLKGGHAIGIVFGLSLLEALDDAGKLLVVKGQIGPAALAHDPGPHHGPLRQRRSTRYSASSATATRRKYSTTRSSTVLIV